MKKTIPIFAFLLCGVCCSQTKENTPAVVKNPNQDTTLAIILKKDEYKHLTDLIKTADEKPSLLNEYIAFLNSRTQIIPPQPITDSTKKKGK